MRLKKYQKFFLFAQILALISLVVGPSFAQDCSMTTPPTCSYVPVGQTVSVTPTAFASPSPSCQSITNNGCPADIMVPTHTQSEWSSFINNHETCVSINDCDQFNWVQGGFGDCSVSCGGGTKTQTVTCSEIDATTGTTTTVANTLCPAASMPPTSASCNPTTCPPLAPIVTLKASTNPVTFGQTTQITYSVSGTGITSCTASGDQSFSGSVSTSGNTVVIIPAATENLGISCTNAGGTGTASLTLTVVSGGNAYCWGSYVGNGTSNSYSVPTAVSPPAGSSTPLSFTQISTGLSDGACGLTSSGQAYCWGDTYCVVSGGSGQKGNANAVTTCYPELVPTAVPAPTGSSTPLTFMQVSGSAFGGCGLTSSGQAYCWGNDTQGQIGSVIYAGESCSAYQNGDGGGTYCSVPLPVSGNLAFKQITFGGATTCGLTTDGKAYCWGFAGYIDPTATMGVIGNSNSIINYTPTAVPGPASSPSTPLVFTQISQGSLTVCGLTTSGKAYCWGDDSTNQVGDGNHTADDGYATYRANPTPVSTTLTFSQIAPGSNVTCGVATTGDTYCWGEDTGGFIDGKVAKSGTRTFVGVTKINAPKASTKFTEVVNGGGIELTTSGSVYNWPVPVSLLVTSPPLSFSQISGGGAAACGIAQ